MTNEKLDEAKIKLIKLEKDKIKFGDLYTEYHNKVFEIDRDLEKTKLRIEILEE